MKVPKLSLLNGNKKANKKETSKANNKENFKENFKVCSKCKKIKETKNFNKRKNSFRSECRECQSLDHFNYLRRKRYKKKLLNQINDIETSQFKMKKTDYGQAFDGINFYEIKDQQFITIPLVSQSERLQGDPFSIIKILQQKLKNIMNMLSIKRKFSISLLLKLSLINQKKEVFEHQVETNQRKVESSKEIDLAICDIFDDFELLLENINTRSSGLCFKDIISISCKIAKIKVLRGGLTPKLPEFLASKRCLYNPKSKANTCFIDCIKMFISINNDSNTSNDKIQKLNNLTDFHNEVSIKMIKEFERLTDIQINVFYLSKNNKEDKEENEFNKRYIFKVIDDKENKDEGELIYTRIYPKTQREDIEKHCNLLLYKKHYFLITNINQFFNVKKFKCFNCFCNFESRSDLNKHLFFCRDFKPITIKFPKEDFIFFKNYEKQVVNPFIIYCDFETILENNEEENSKEKVKKIHKPVAFYCLTVCRSDEKYNRHFSYIGEDSSQKYVDYIKEELIRISEISQKNAPLAQDDAIEEAFKGAFVCYLCGGLFTEEDFKVRDHDHINGFYRGAAHNSCNVSYLRKKNYIPIVFHNLENYDSHLFIKELNKEADVQVLAKSSEKFFTISAKFKDKNCIFTARFIDSFLFLPYSLKELSKNLETFKYNTDKNLLGKQAFPYEYCTSFDKLKEDYHPNIHDFYSSLTNETISLEEFNLFVKNFNLYKCKNLKDYISIYLKVDVLLLADIFENFRTKTLKDYNLDPSNYLTIPSLSWDACLKFSKIRLQIIKNIDILNMFTKGIRGGISTVGSLRFAEANNQFLKEYNSKDENSFIIYLDANNLYGHSMCQPLPVNNFKFRDDLIEDLSMAELYKITKDNFNQIDIKRVIKQTNFILEVDLEYPEILHDEHNDLPLAPEHLNGKLIPNLNGKEHYIVHFRNLDFYLKHGMKLKKIHKILQFTESNWMKRYIEFNTQRRMEAKNEFNKCFYKLMINSLYGKSIENVRKRVVFKLANNDKKALTLCSKPNYKRYIELDKNSHIIELSKLEIIYDKPIYLGMAILELSKLHLYSFHYGIMKSNFDCTLLYTDTDSLMYLIKSPNIYDELKNKMIFNKNNNSYENINQYIDNNKSMEIGKFKDECNGKIIKSFVGLKSKLYSLLFEDNSGIAKCKGVNKNIINKNILHEDYKNSLFEMNQKFVEFSKFKSKNHNLQTIIMKKLCLDSKDDKRVNLDSIKTLAIGHYRLRKNEMEEDEKDGGKKVERNVPKMVEEDKQE